MSAVPDNSSDHRKLAAIMFTDMVGYSALAQKNETLALELLEEHRGLLRDVFPRFNGAEIKTIGDAFLVEFHSALEAVRCAVAIQQRLREHNLVATPEHPLRIRIGLHLGDVIHRESDVYGDGVNIAARIEPLAAPGGICLTQQIYDHVHNKLDVPLIKVGAKELKNIQLPVTIYCVQLSGKESQVGVGERLRRQLRRKEVWRLLVALVGVGALLGIAQWLLQKPATKSIAVLPFENLTPDRENEYLSDGITDQLIDALVQVGGLSVPSRTSAFVFKNRREDIRQIGRRLHVATVLEGTLRQAGNKLRVTVQMTRVENGFQMWSQSYDWEKQDPFAIQEEISRKVIAKLNVHGPGDSTAPLVKRTTENNEALQCYLQGLFFLNRRTEADLNKAKDFFQKAIAIDPNYALAHAGVADCYNALAYLNFLAPKEAFPKAKAAATRALEIDGGLPAPHAAVGYYLMYHEFDFRAAEREFRRAIELNPNYVTARHYYSIYLTAMGRMKEARDEIERAQKLDFLSVPITTDMGFELHYSGKQEEAVRQLQSALEMNPQFPLAHFWLGRIYTTQRQYEKALAEYDAVPTLQSWQPMMAAKGFLFGIWGKPDEARKILADFEARRSMNRFVTSYGVALVHAGLGDSEEALKWLERAYEEKSHWLVWLQLDPRWTRLREEPRFQMLMKKVGLSK